MISIGFPSWPGNFSNITCAAIAAELLAGRTLLSTCEKTIFFTGAASTVNIIKDRTTTETGLRITNLATSAHLPSSLVTFTLLRTKPLSILLPKIASKAGSAIKAPRTAINTTVIPA